MNKSYIDLNFSKENWDRIQEWLSQTAADLGAKIALALFLLIGGIVLIRMFGRLINRTFRRYNIEPSLGTFLESLIKFVLYALLVVSIGTTLGIKTSSFVAIIGAIGIAIGLALQGSLANFAGGVLILVFKPFKVGDLINVNGSLGTVVKIDILYTRLVTFDNRVITMPNGNVANSDVDNRTMQPQRRIDLKLKFHYETDIKRVREIVVSTLEKHEKVLSTPAPDLWLDEIGEYQLHVIARCWVRPEDYWPVIWEQYEAVKEALEEEGIDIPIPKQEVLWKAQGVQRGYQFSEQ